MADDDDNHESRNLTQREITGVADRCLARGISALFDPTYLKKDFLLISALLRQLASDHPDGVQIDVWKDGL